MNKNRNKRPYHQIKYANIGSYLFNNSIFVRRKHFNVMLPTQDATYFKFINTFAVTNIAV